MKELSDENRAHFDDRDCLDRIVESTIGSMANIFQIFVGDLIYGNKATQYFIGKIDVAQSCPMCQFFVTDSRDHCWHKQPTIRSISRTYHFFESRDNVSPTSRGILHGGYQEFRTGSVLVCVAFVILGDGTESTKHDGRRRGNILIFLFVLQRIIIIQIIFELPSERYCQIEHEFKSTMLTSTVQYECKVN